MSLGKQFENLTNPEEFLLNDGYKKVILNKKYKHGYYLFKNFDNKKIIYVSQSGLKIYIKQKYNIDLFRICGEAYIIETNKNITIKIIEKKYQEVEGSVETKLWASPSLKREYELVLGIDFDIEYIFCLNKYFKNKFL